MAVEPGHLRLTQPELQAAPKAKAEGLKLELTGTSGAGGGGGGRDQNGQE